MSDAIRRQARQLCTEDHYAPDAPWFCPTCRIMEQRLQPVSEVLKGVMTDANLTLTVNWADAVHDHCYGGDDG